MLYRILKIWVRLASYIFCRKIIINDRSKLKSAGPLLLACNHPNSFLDAVILDILFKNPVWSLARGDVFKNNFYRKLLIRLKMLPVYRTSEGVENLENNYLTFDSCKKIFREKGIVLMFSEGSCENEWHLRPLKKGTARLAFSSWDEGIDLKVLPVGINYSSFRRFGKNIIINFGEFISNDMITHETDGKRFNSFNEILTAQLHNAVMEIPRDDTEAQKKLMVKTPTLIRAILFIPAVPGWIIHAPFYFPLKVITIRTLKDPEHYDGVVTGLITILYPLYLLLITGLLFMLSGSLYSFLAIVICPLMAWCLVRIKGQLDHKGSIVL